MARLIESLRLRIRPQLLGGIGRALASRNYRLYACGHIAHVHGWFGNRLGIGWLTWELTDSALWLGITAFVGLFPVMLLAPLGGALADRYGHRQTAILGGVLGSVSTMAIGILALMGEMTIPLLLILTVVQGSLFGMEFPARQALIPQLVGRSNIAAAIAFNSTSFQVGAFVGPVLAGLLIVNFGAGASVLLYGFTTILMATIIFLIRHQPERAPGTDRQGILAEVVEGFRYLAGYAPLRLLFTLSFASGLLIRPYNELLPGFSADVFERGAEGLAALNAAAGLGALLSAVYLVFRGRAQGLVRIMMVSAVLSCLGLALFTLTANFTVGLIALAFAAMMLLASHVGWMSLIQNVADPVMRGRIISFNVSVGLGAPALGALLLGWLAEMIGLRQALAATSLLALVIVLLSFRPMLRRTAELEADPVL